MNSIFERRRSIFPQFFTDQAIDKATIEDLLSAANSAPSHRKTEPWRFRVFRGEGRKELMKLMPTIYNAGPSDRVWDEKLEKKFSSKVMASDTVLAVFLHRDPEERVPEWEEIAAVGCAVQNLWLALDEAELGGYWSSPGFLCGDYGQWPGAADNERCLGVFYIGHHNAPDLPRPRGPWEEKVTWVE
jgi:nitroreductase